MLFRGELKLEINELNLDGLFDCCSSLTGRFPRFVLFKIISAVVVEVFYYNLLWNLKKYKLIHLCLKTDATFMQEELISLNGHIFFFTILCINFIFFDQPLVSLEHLTLQKCYLCEN